MVAAETGYVPVKVFGVPAAATVLVAGGFPLGGGAAQAGGICVSDGGETVFEAGRRDERTDLRQRRDQHGYRGGDQLRKR